MRVDKAEYTFYNYRRGWVKMTDTVSGYISAEEALERQFQDRGNIHPVERWLVLDDGGLLTEFRVTSEPPTPPQPVIKLERV